MSYLQSIRVQASISCGLIISALSLSQAAESVTLQWNPTSSSNIAGYRLYYGTRSGVYSQHLDVGNETTTSVSNLSVGQTYFFSVTAYNATAESARSNEVSYTVRASTATAQAVSRATSNQAAAVAATPHPAATVAPTRTTTPPSNLNQSHDMQTRPVRRGGSVEAAAYAEWCRELVRSGMGGG
jgi:hypothetical protein